MPEIPPSSRPPQADEDGRRAALRALQGLSLEEAVELLLELGVLDPAALAERRDAQEREWRLTSAELLGDQLEALRRQARQQRRKAQALHEQTHAQRRMAIAAREEVIRIDERRRALADQARARTAAAALEEMHRALGAALAAGRILAEDAPQELELGSGYAPPGQGPGLEVRSEREDARMVLVAAGEIDMATAGRLEAALEEAFAAGETDVRVDLTDVRFMDSTGVSALLSARRALPPGARLSVVCPPGPCRRVLELTGVPRTIELLSDRRKTSP